MVDTAGLRLDQAPPIHLPLRLLLSAPWFAMAAGLLLMGQGETALASRWTPAALASTHLIVIGFLGQVLCGALLQLLPVLVGAPVPRVGLVATLVHLALVCGASLLALGLLGLGSWALTLGAALSLAGFGIFLSAAGVALARARGAPATRMALGLAALALLPTLALGAALAAALLGWIDLSGLPVWVDLHLAWGLFGWVGLLILGVGYQVVPMFHVTPAYPKALTRSLAPLLFALLLAGSLALVLGQDTAIGLIQGGAALGFSAFALTTLWLQGHRARSRLDPTLLHWWSALGSMIAAALAWGLGAPGTLIGVLLLVGVGVGLPSGMVLKIVPFLCWFHLQQRQIAGGRFEVRVPYMHGFMQEPAGRWQWALHLVALGVLAAGTLDPRLIPLGGLLLGFAALGLGLMLLGAARLYRQTRLALDRPRETGPPP